MSVRRLSWRPVSVVLGATALIAAVWLPGGFAIAALVLFGVNMWPGVFAGALVGYSTTTGTIASGVIFTSMKPAGSVTSS